MKHLLSPMLLAGASLGLSFATPVAGEVLTLRPVADVTIRSDQANTSQFQGQLLLVGDIAGEKGALRSVLGFDLAAALPADAVVRSASLRLSIDGPDRDSADSPDKLQLHLLGESFAAESATWTRRSANERWAVPGALPPGATPLATAEANAAHARAGQPLALGGPALVRAVETRRAGRIDLLVKLANEDAQRGVFRFGSSRARSRSPLLVVEYDLAHNPSGVVPIPGHAERPLSPRYRLTVGGRPVEVRAERFDFDVAMFDVPAHGAPVEIELLADTPAVTLKPARHGITPSREGRFLRFDLRGPSNIVLQSEGLVPLALLATPPETDVPSPDSPDVVYYPPGVTIAGVIRPRSGQTLYLAPGALVKGRVEAKGVSDVSIRGRGILETSGYSRREDKTHGILFEDSRRIRIEGIGLRAHHTWWQTLFLKSRDIEIAHMNLFGVGVNTDGIDIDGVRDFLVRDTFIRAEDDGLGWHALDAEANGEPSTERAYARDLVIWNTHAGNGIRLGASMEAQLWRDIVVERTDILMHAGSGIYSDYSDWALSEDVVFRDITIDRPKEPIAFKILKTHYSNNTGFLDARGHIERLVFEDVTMAGGRITLLGHGPGARIDRVRFIRCTNGGKPLRSLADITINAHVTDVRFDEPLPPRPATPAGRHEAEHLESSTNTRPQLPFLDAALSGGKGRALLATAVGDHVEYTLENVPAGPHRLRLGVLRTPGSGKFRLSLNGVPVGAEQDLFATTPTPHIIDFGPVTLPAAATHSVRLTVSGANAAGTAHRLDVDFIELTPLR